MTRKRISIDDLLNELTFKNIYNRLKLLALNMFEWKGLPEGMKQEYIERILYSEGKALFFNDPDMGLLCLHANPAEGVNVYGMHIKYYGTGFNYNKLYDMDNSVLIKNNALMDNMHDNIMMYSNKIVEIERTLDVNIKAQKTPRIIACDDKDILTFKNIFKDIDGNTPAIYADKNLNLKSLEVLDITAPFVATELADYRHDVWNEVLTFLGINNANTDKKERLVTDEVNANNDVIDINSQLMLDTRVIACTEINAMFGTSISVAKKEGEKDGTVHVGNTGTDGE